MARIAISTDELAKLFVSGTSFTAKVLAVKDRLDSNNKALLESGAMEGSQGDDLRAVITKLGNNMEKIKTATKQLDFVLDDKIGQAIKSSAKKNYAGIDESVLKLVNRRLKK